MEKKIEELYIQAVYDDLPPNVFAQQVMQLLFKEPDPNKRCVHPVDRLRLIGTNITCLECQSTWKQIA